MESATAPSPLKRIVRRIRRLFTRPTAPQNLQQRLDAAIADFEAQVTAIRQAMVTVDLQERIAVEETQATGDQATEWNEKATAAILRADTATKRGQPSDAERYNNLAAVAASRAIEKQTEHAKRLARATEQAPIIAQLRARTLAMETQLATMIVDRDELLSRQAAITTHEHTQSFADVIDSSNYDSVAHEIEASVTAKEAQLAARSEIEALLTDLQASPARQESLA